ncbi:MAG: hypothetical protein KAS21_02065 [Candidatus Aminicenantes bacterium]|nr:hypothetical protein [Candidatus Aminicenantes bacterium]
MKRSLMLIAIFMVTSFIVFGQSITVTSPAAGNEWIISSTHDITWSKTGDMNEFVKIRLFDRTGTIRVLAIADRTANNGIFRDWTIPSTISPGDYIVKVKTVDNAVEDDSGVFSIRREVLEEIPSINVTSPSSSSRWERGRTKTISWTKIGTMDSRVKIHLMNEAGTSEVLAIIANTPNDENHPWPIPGTLSAGRYRVRVQTLDNRVTKNSQIFNITTLPTITLPESTVVETRRVLPESSGPVIRVVYPNGGETLTRGSRVEIRWECVDGFNPPRIKIQKNGRTIREYGPSRLYPVPSRGGYIWPWFVPSDLAPGSDYKIRIEKGDFSRSNDKSDNNFTISSDLNIEVVEPRGGGLVATNGKIIRWRAGGVEGNVNVHLQRADGRGGDQLIRSNVPATPSHFLWYVGALERAGTIISRENYKIIVSSADGSVSGESNSFQIIVPTLEVTSPGSGRKRLEDTLSIRWNNSPGFHGNVNVILEQQRERGTFTEYQTLFTNTHDKSLSWRIPPDHGLDPFPTGRNYRIVVRSVRCPNLIIARGAWFEVR